MKKRLYETYQKINGKYHFQGWYEMLEEKYCIKTTKKTYKDKEYINGQFIESVKSYIYKTYKWQNGKIDYIKYGTYIEE